MNYIQGNGEVRLIKALGPTQRADGVPLAIDEISFYSQFMTFNGGPISEMAVNLVDDVNTAAYDGHFDEAIDIDTQEPGTYEYWYQTVDTGGRSSVDSEHVSMVILPPLVAPNPPTNIVVG